MTAMQRSFRSRGGLPWWWWRHHADRRARGSEVAVPFTPLSLFAAGEVGGWWDPSDLTTLFQLSTGTTPVTADGQPVGYIADKSGRGNHLTQATAGSRPLYKTSGGLRWLQFDGVDDFLATGNVTLSGTNKLSIFTGMRKISSATAMYVGFGTNVNSVDGTFELLTPNATNEFVIGYNGTGAAAFASYDNAAFVSPITVVNTSLLDFAAAAAGVATMRLNGVQRTLTGAGAGGGNFAAALPIYVGRRAGTTIPFSGWMYGLIIRGAASTAGQISDTEAYMAAKAGVTI